MPIPPLNGTKTHPLTPAAYTVLTRLAEAPLPKPEVNPGVVNRLEREALIELVNLPSPYKSKPGLYLHLKITPAGLAALSNRPKP